MIAPTTALTPASAPVEPAPPAAAPAGRAAARWRRVDPAVTVIVAAWAFVVIPRLIQSLTAPKFRTRVGAPVPFSPAAARVDLVMAYALITVCVLVILSRLGRLPVRHRGALLALLAPWVYLVCRNLYIDARPDRGALVYPLIAVVVWMLRPRLDRLAVLGHLVGLTALVSIGLGAVLPSKGIYTSVSGQLITPEKQILPGGVLIGAFSDSNNLAQFLVLGLPAILLVRHRAWRAVLLVADVYAIVWTSSRSSIAAAAVVVVLALVLSRLPQPARRPLALAAMGAAAAVMVALPLVTDRDTAFTNRGFFWRSSLEAWTGSRLFGWGSTWYSELAKYANELGGFAFHGHNLFVHTLVTGGLIGLALVAVLVVVVADAAGHWAARRWSFPAVYVTALLVSCTLEVSLGFVDREFLTAVTIVPIAFVCFATDSPRPDARS